VEYYEGERMRAQKIIDELKKIQIEQGYIKLDGTPIKCTNCESKNIGIRNEQYIANNLCEYEEYCKDCNTILGYWGYGSWGL
jgi:hypothetical protein